MKHKLFLLSCILIPFLCYSITVNDFMKLTPESVKELSPQDVWTIITLLLPLVKIIVYLTKSKEDDKWLKLIIQALTDYLPLIKKK